ncbi:hypothetical protein [Polaromonas naphthalenivorans]|uniref:hypothetical protein n=1 Tax=Polaromonas naphthalenivorans TaxID=216465 RepID=UPI0012ED8A42|nr:hypothetical protein [Polaromonas naphthalenivorans]
MEKSLSRLIQRQVDSWLAVAGNFCKPCIQAMETAVMQAQRFCAALVSHPVCQPETKKDTEFPAVSL